ncbi:MAG TPA: long-chain fatty acid--CoA ligase [Egibacteraceae bacterium]
MAVDEARARTEVSGPPPVAVNADENLTSSLWEREVSRADGVILKHHDGSGWRDVTWGEAAERVRTLAAGLIASGIAPGDKVALMSTTRIEWTLLDLAILSVGAVTVPIYETSSVEQCVWILSDSGTRLAIAGSADEAKVLAEACDRVPGVTELLVIDEGGLDALAQRAGDAEREEVARRAAAVKAADLATIVYTSGTSGNPKGCLITHYNLLWTARQAGVVLRTILKQDDATLLFLTLAHVFTRLIQFMCWENDVPIGYARSIDLLTDDLQTFRPTFLLSVPRVFERVYTRAQRMATGAKRKVFDFAVATAEELGKTASPSPLLRLKHAVADRLVYSKIRHAFGGRVHTCVSGGAPLAPHLAYFFSACGVEVLEGWGLTETTAPCTVNPPGAPRVGTVGTPLPGVEVRIDSDGEILVRGGNVFNGYHNNPEATAEVFEDGWLRTGDLGRLDADGYLAITGRKKEIIVTAGGKNVAPALLEERLKVHPLVSQAMVVGDNRPFVGALITIDPDELAAHAERHGLSGPPSELIRHESVRAEIDKAVAHANSVVSRAESIRNVVVLERDFDPDHDEVTPSLKLRRRVIAQHFAAEIEQLYTR